jgi:hypothetical protein
LEKLQFRGIACLRIHQCQSLTCLLEDVLCVHEVIKP